MDTFEILGQTILKEAVGDSFGGGGGFDTSFLINAASELAQRGANTVEQSENKKKSDAATQAQLGKAIAADSNWAGTEAVLDLANQSHDASRIGPAQALQMAAMSAAMSAGAGLPADAVTKRVAAAQDAANKAAQDALSSPKDAAKQATMRAWQKVLASAGSSGGALTAGGAAHGGKFGGAGGNFLTKKWGPLPVWGWGLTTIGVVGVGALVAHMLRR